MANDFGGIGLVWFSIAALVAVLIVKAIVLALPDTAPDYF